ncbi:MAG: two-component system response regulator [Desulfobacterales bacterium]|nr:MAG: two-component system response regulator [Desulfobacterales bacterium]
MNEHVLLIDDEPEFIETLGERMMSRGMNVTSTTSAKEGIEAARKQFFDVVVLDLQMPDMDGLETLKALKENNPDIQVILLTGHATVEKGISAMKLGAMDLLEKPADISVLTDKIHKAQTTKMILVEKKASDRIKKIMETRGW